MRTRKQTPVFKGFVLARENQRSVNLSDHPWRLQLNQVRKELLQFLRQVQMLMPLI